MPELVEKIVELFEPPACAKGVELSASLDADARGAFRGAANGLRRILLNLVANAVKFTKSVGVAVAISATPCEADRA